MTNHLENAAHPSRVPRCRWVIWSRETYYQAQGAFIAFDTFMPESRGNIPGMGCDAAFGVCQRERMGSGTPRLTSHASPRKFGCGDRSARREIHSARRFDRFEHRFRCTVYQIVSLPGRPT